jgi:hypothetical protein
MHITTEPKPVLRHRVLWFVGIYIVSVIVFGAVSGLLELLLPK